MLYQCFISALAVLQTCDNRWWGESGARRDGGGVCQGWRGWRGGVVREGAEGGADWYWWGKVSGEIEMG